MTKLAALTLAAAMLAVAGGAQAPVATQPVRATAAHAVPIPNAPRKCECIHALPAFHGAITVVPMRRAP
jgi:hypothetical protein